MRRALLMGGLREFGDLPNLIWASKRQTRCSRVKSVPVVVRATFLKALPTSGDSGNARQAIEAGADKGMTVICQKICEPLEQVLC